jgi:hypothetical protein
VVLDEAAKLVADRSDDRSDGLLLKLEAWKNLLEMHEVGTLRLPVKLPSAYNCCSN